MSQDEREQYDCDDEYETLFYESFKMARHSSSTDRRTGVRKASKGATTNERIYRVGDAVLIETNTLDTMKKPPSIAIIVSMWDLHKIHEDTEDSDHREMKIRVHWFLRPSELARVRANREHLQVRWLLKR